MSFIQNFIAQDPFLSNAKIWRHRHYVVGQTKERCVLHTFSNHPVNWWDGKWKPIDENLKPKNNQHVLEHLPFWTGQGVRALGGLHWKPLSIGGFGKTYKPLAKIDHHLIKDNKIVWESGSFLYETSIHAETIKDNLYLSEVPSIADPYFAIEFEANALPTIPIVQDSGLRSSLCTLVSKEDRIYLLVPMPWLAKACYPVDVDPDYGPASRCFFSRSASSTYSTVHGLDPSSCDDAQNSMSITQGTTGFNQYYWGRGAVTFNLTGVTDMALQASTTWAKETESISGSDYTIAIYRADWSAYDYTGACQAITCPEGPNINDIIRDSATHDEDILDQNDDLDTYYTAAGMNTTWINNVTQDAGEDFVYYALKTTEDHSATAPTESAEGCSVYTGGSSYPPYLTLEFSTDTRVFGTIIG